MNNITMLYPKGKTKVLTFSYDDGIKQDIRLVNLFNNYGLKSTFNLNSIKIYEPRTYESHGVTIKSIKGSKLAQTFLGHEIATHSYSHPHFTRIHESSIDEEINQDRLELEKISGYIVRGHAYPFGEYDNRVIRQLKCNSIIYARTTSSTEKFGFPHDFLTWHPTCHHNSPKLLELLDKFLNPNSCGSLFYIWGHSYEFDINDNWSVIEEFCEKASGYEDIWYATNIEIYDYIHAYYNLQFSADNSIIHNPSAIEIYLKLNDKMHSIKSNETISLD